MLIADEKTKRNRWKMAVVEEVRLGRDNFVRGCKLRTLTPKTKKITYLNRPINKLCPLEISSEGECRE